MTFGLDDNDKLAISLGYFHATVLSKTGHNILGLENTFRNLLVA